MKQVKKAYFPFNLILWIFKKTRKNKNTSVAMIDPFLLNIVTINKDLKISAWLYNHELVHIEQVRREGRIKFICKYLFYNMKYGYYNNPYEVEARKGE